MNQSTVLAVFSRDHISAIFFYAHLTHKMARFFHTEKASPPWRGFFHTEKAAPHEQFKVNKR